MIEKFFKKVLLSYMFLFPAISFAAPFAGVNSLLIAFKNLVGQAIPVAFSLGILFFFYGIALYVLRAGDEKKAKEGKSIMIYGVIAIFVMSSIWGLIAFIDQELGISNPSTYTGLE